MMIPLAALLVQNAIPSVSMPTRAAVDLLLA
jgi:hypothetical protein